MASYERSEGIAVLSLAVARAATQEQESQAEPAPSVDAPCRHRFILITPACRQMIRKPLRQIAQLSRPGVQLIASVKGARRLMLKELERPRSTRNCDRTVADEDGRLPVLSFNARRQIEKTIGGLHGIGSCVRL